MVKGHACHAYEAAWFKAKIVNHESKACLHACVHVYYRMVCLTSRVPVLSGGRETLAIPTSMTVVLIHASMVALVK